MPNVSIFKLNRKNYQKSQKLQPSARAFDEKKPMIFESEINKYNQCKTLQVMWIAFLQTFSVLGAGTSRLCASEQSEKWTHTL